MPETTSQTLEPTLKRPELETEPEVDTMPAADALGELQYSFERPPAQQERLSPEEYIERGVQGLVNTLDAWLCMKTKNELMVQFFKGKLSIKVARIAELIVEEVSLEQERHMQDAQCLNKERTALATSYDGTLPVHVAQREIENLRQREMVHIRMAAYIASLPESDEDWLGKLTSECIERTKVDAYKEAMKLLHPQEKEQAVLN